MLCRAVRNSDIAQEISQAFFQKMAVKLSRSDDGTIINNPRATFRQMPMRTLPSLDAENVIDRPTFAQPNQYSKGIIHVIVGGQIIVKDEVLQEGIFPGHPISTKSK